MEITGYRSDMIDRLLSQVIINCCDFNSENNNGSQKLVPKDWYILSHSILKPLWVVPKKDAILIFFTRG